MLEIYQSSEFAKWRKKLKDPLAKAKVAARVNRYAQGLKGDVEPVGEAVSEMRIDYGPGYRVYFREIGQKLLLLLGGDKDSQQRDIKRAKEIAREWKND